MARTMEEQEQNLWIASSKYVRGEISLDKLEAIESAESEKLKNAIYILAQYGRRKSLLNFFRLF